MLGRVVLEILREDETESRELFRVFIVQKLHFFKKKFKRKLYIFSHRIQIRYIYICSYEKINFRQFDSLPVQTESAFFTQPIEHTRFTYNVSPNFGNYFIIDLSENSSETKSFYFGRFKSLKLISKDPYIFRNTKMLF